MRNRSIAAALALLLGACSSSTLSTHVEVSARAGGDATLAITNDGDAPVHVLAVDPAELMMVAPCLPQTCPRLAPGETLRLPYAEIAGYQAGDRQASVLWWMPANAGAPRPDGTVTVEL